MSFCPVRSVSPPSLSHTWTNVSSLCQSLMTWTKTSFTRKFAHTEQVRINHPVSYNCTVKACESKDILCVCVCWLGTNDKLLRTSIIGSLGKVHEAEINLNLWRGIQVTSCQTADEPLVRNLKILSFLSLSDTCCDKWLLLIEPPLGRAVERQRGAIAPTFHERAAVDGNQSHLEMCGPICLICVMGNKSSGRVSHPDLHAKSTLEDKCSPHEWHTE